MRSLPVKPAIVSLVIFLAFTGYYHFLSVNLPANAGPDEFAHLQAIDFIYQNNRLATFPEDEGEIYLTPYGTTRSYNAPFAYVWAALVSETYAGMVNGELSRDAPPAVEPLPIRAHRQGAVLMASLSVVLLFAIVYLLTAQAAAALLAAALMGLMPQFSFLASYANNDIAAIFILLCLVAGLVAALKYRNTLSFAAFGLGCGLVLLAKPTSWFPALLAALCVLTLATRRSLLRRLLLVSLPVALLTGGWWYAFNVYHHGIDDLRNGEVSQTLQQKHQTLPDSAIQSYSDLGHGLTDLLTNELEFLSRSYKSTVGHIDWLRVSMGPMQYTSYGLLLMLGLGYLLASVRSKPPAITIKSWGTLSLLLIIGILLQIGVFLWWNLEQDRQPQGRYLLPALSFLFISAGVCFAGIKVFVDRKLGATAGYAVAAAALLAVVAVHKHAMFQYVIPFYSPHALLEPDRDHLRLQVDDERVFSRTNDIALKPDDDNFVVLEVTGPDPWLLLNLDAIKGTAQLNYIELVGRSSVYDEFKLYWDNGGGFSEARSSSHALKLEHGKIGLRFPRHSKRLRLDFGEKVSNAFHLHRIHVGRTDHKFPLLNRLLAKLDRLMRFNT